MIEIKREKLLRFTAGLCMITAALGMIYGKSQANTEEGKNVSYIEETGKEEKKEKSTQKKETEEKSQMTAAKEIADTEEQKIEEAKAVEATIVPGQYPVLGESSIRPWQLVAYFNEHGSSYPTEILGQGGAPDIETFAQICYEEATAEGVRPEVAFAQAMKETGWLQYGGDMQITQYNFAGIGTTGGGVPGNSYPDVKCGIRAQIQHLKAYATDEALTQECVDDRYSYVTKGSAPYVEWLGQKENPEGYGWATGENYGYDIVDMIHAMRKESGKN